VSGSIKELQVQAASFNKDAGKVRGNIAAADTALEAIRSSRAALLESATLEQVGAHLGGIDCRPEVIASSAS
jgi:hypothetical protein